MHWELIADTSCTIGEGVLYHPDERAVYWIDIPSGEVFRHRPNEAGFEILRRGNPIGGFTFEADGSLLFFGDNGAVTRWTEQGESPVADFDIRTGRRFNDVIADRQGRVFAGTMDENDHSVGALYRLDPGGELTELESDIALPNGMGFSTDFCKFYLVETDSNTIYAYEYDEASGGISNREILSQRDSPDKYDGLTVDTEGYLWVGLWNGAAIERLTPDGEVDTHTGLPATNVTTLAFGGPNYQTAFISTAALDAPEADEYPGALMSVQTHAKGRPESFSRITL